MAALCSIITRDLHGAGFTLNDEILYPVQEATWFVFIINTTDFTFSLPEDGAWHWAIDSSVYTENVQFCGQITHLGRETRVGSGYDG